jgi:hypothetical protein
VVLCIIAGSYPRKRTPIIWWHADNSVPCALQDGRFWKLSGDLVRGETLHLGCWVRTVSLLFIRDPDYQTIFILAAEESTDVLTTTEISITLYFDQGGKKNWWNENSIMTCLRLVPRFNFS